MSKSLIVAFNTDEEKSKLIKYVCKNNMKSSTKSLHSTVNAKIKEIIGERGQSKKLEYLARIDLENALIWLPHSFFESSEMLMEYFENRNAKRRKYE